MAAADQRSLLGRYRLMDVLLRKLNAVRENIEETLSARSPLEKYEDAEENLRDKWEKELKAAIEAEYRGQRADFLLALQWWLRDVWLHTLGVDQSPESNALSPNSETLLVFPQMAGTKRVAQRISPKAAMENLRIIEQLQRWLHTNVQEALALEVGLLKLHL
jgi:DNA polymerase-3 subunit delta'